MITTPSVIISPEQLRDALAHEPHLVILEIERGDEDAADTYESGHIPGAHKVLFGQDLAGPATATSGSSPLPDPLDLQTSFATWGINDDSVVVVYARQNPTSATRAWWVLRWAGVSDVRFLAGGLRAWRGIGGALDSEEPPNGNGQAQVRPGSLPVLTADDAAQVAASGHLLDSRHVGGYAGSAPRPGQSAGGHIPGALSLPAAQNFVDGALKDPVELAELYAPYLDGKPVGAYCGGGVAATATVLALAHLGVEAALFPGSWSQWITDPDRPIATGDRPGIPSGPGDTQG